MHEQTFFTLLKEVRAALRRAHYDDQLAEFMKRADAITYREDYEELLHIAVDYVEFVK